MTPGWVGPTVAISLAIIALSFLAIGGGSLFLVLTVKKQLDSLKTHLAKFREDALVMTNKIKGEVDGYVDISADTRDKLKSAVASVETRLNDLDALVEVLQEEAEDTALDVAAFVRTARHAGGMLGTARKMMRRRRRHSGD